MSKTTIGAGTVVSDAAAPDAAALAALGEDTQVARRNTNLDGGLTLAGGNTGIRPAYLNIAYEVCKWFDPAKFSNNALVLNREFQLVKQGEPLIAIIVSATEFWREWADKDFQKTHGRFPKDYPTEAAAIADGQKTQGFGKARTVAPAYDLALLVKQPEGCECPLFTIKLGNDWFALVSLRAEKMLAQDVGPFLKSLAMIDYKEGTKKGRLSTWFTSFTTVRKVRGDSKWTSLSCNRVYNPANKTFDRVSDEAHEDFEQLRAMFAGAWIAPAVSDDEPLPEETAAGEPPVATMSV